MFNDMFRPLIDEYSEKVQPHIQAVGQRADGIAWTIVGLLGRIVENTANDEQYLYGRKRYTQNLLTADPPLELDQVPMGQTWVLENAWASAGNVTLTDGNFPVVVFTGSAEGPKGTVFLPGSKIVADASADCSIYLQFRVRVPGPGRQATTGMQNPGVHSTVNPQTARHTAPGVGQVPIRPTGDTPASGGQGV